MDVSCRSKRKRTIFTADQLERLEKEFDRQQYIVGSQRFYLAADLGLNETQVKIWFQNRRIKWRRQNLALRQSPVRSRFEGEETEWLNLNSLSYSFVELMYHCHVNYHTKLGTTFFFVGITSIPWIILTAIGRKKVTLPSQFLVTPRYHFGQ